MNLSFNWTPCESLTSFEESESPRNLCSDPRTLPTLHATPHASLWRNHTSQKNRERERERVLEECLYEQRPHDMSTTTCTTQPQGLAICSRCHPAWASEASQWCVPSRTPTIHWGAKDDGEAVGGPTPTPQMGKSRCNDASPRQSNTHVFQQTW